MTDEEKEAVKIALISQIVKNHDTLIKLLLLNITVTSLILFRFMLE